ncbi:hypothetical protein ANCCAN_10330 [Ancylostoma caninum]|uniref:Uncharacterized protein n=1 Tax=Ancylostoma caninum TaxID=29170 RepID=A0A368GH23_ANCCA|nr:hypothetical protein ANCCAN_10330 [Ancylostoma caninum]
MPKDPLFQTNCSFSVGSTAPHGLAYLLCNLFAVAGNTVNNRLNRKYYSNTSRISTTVGRYTLAERYQISENICTSKALRDTFYLVPFFNALCLAAIFIDNFDVGIAAKNLSSVCLNFAALIYALLVPLVLLLHKKNLRRECEKLLKGVGLHNLNNAYRKSQSLRSTLGEEIIIDKLELSTTHFTMLRNDWEGQRREKQPVATTSIIR